MKISTADSYFSKYIRLKAAVNGKVTCCTCGKVMEWNECHAGHFINRRHKGTRFEERNVHPQCPKCNMYGEGEPAEYSLFLKEKYGPDVIEELIEQKNTFTKMGKKQIQEVGDEYREKLKSIS